MKQFSYNRKKVGDWLFFFSLIAIPMIVFILLNIGGMIQSFSLAFSKYDYKKQEYVFAGFYNFADVIRSFSSDALLRGSVWNSFKYYLAVLIIVTPAGWLFSFLIYKKMPFHGILKVVLFMPSVISGLIYIMIYRSFVQDALPLLMSPFGIKVEHILTGPDTAYNALLVYTLWMSLCGNVLIGTGVMSKIPEETIEALQVDGATVIQEFIHLTIPVIYPLLVLGYSTGIMLILQGQPSTFPFFNTEGPSYVYTIGYYLFVKVMGNSTVEEIAYPYSAAAGIMIGYLCLPVVLLIQKVLTKIGPKED